jgi:hypothetical protein
MHGKRKGQIPWDEVGIEAARTLVSTSDEMSRKVKEGLAGLSGPGIPDFEGDRWRYEFCIFMMFWMWYVANSPKLTKAEATKPLLDAYHQGCWDSMVGAGLIHKGEEGVRAWDGDLEERFMAYKGAYENVHAQPNFPLRLTGRGSVGWLFARYLFPGQKPDPRFVSLLNDFGSITFRGLVEMVTSLEAAYRPSWRRRILRIATLSLMWIPIIGSGLANVRKQFGQGVGFAWHSWSDKLFGWGFWAVGVILWIQLIRWAGNFLERKLRP